MRSLRQAALSALLTISAFGAVLYTSCSASKCGTITCLNGSSCSGNVCVCPTGYSGNNCGSAWSTEYTGLYNCTASCHPTQNGSTWQSTIAAATTNGGYTVTISNCSNLGSTFDATVDSANHITISQSAPGSFQISGTGTYDATGKGIIRLHFTTSGSGISSNDCDMVMTKQ